MLDQRSKTLHKKAQNATKNIKRCNRKIGKIQNSMTKSRGNPKMRLAIMLVKFVIKRSRYRAIKKLDKALTKSRMITDIKLPAKCDCCKPALIKYQEGVSKMKVQMLEVENNYAKSLIQESSSSPESSSSESGSSSSSGSSESGSSETSSSESGSSSSSGSSESGSSGSTESGSSGSTESGTSSEEVIDNKPATTETVTESVVESAALLI